LNDRSEVPCKHIARCPFVSAATQYGKSVGLKDDSAAVQHYQLSCLRGGANCDTVKILEMEEVKV
jgi:hypothetical protein